MGLMLVLHDVQLVPECILFLGLVHFVKVEQEDNSWMELVQKPKVKFNLDYFKVE